MIEATKISAKTLQGLCSYFINCLKNEKAELTIFKQIQRVLEKYIKDGKKNAFENLEAQSYFYNEFTSKISDSLSKMKKINGSFVFFIQ